MCPRVPVYPRPRVFFLPYLEATYSKTGRFTPEEVSILASVRVRQHVNPLSEKYRKPVTPPNWAKIYADPTQPLLLDIGCGRGQFLLSMAQLKPEQNFLGIEIREPLVEQANWRRDELGVTNLHYLFCNVNTSLQKLLDSLAEGVLHEITVQFPDPWFKKRHARRRIVQPALVEVLASYLIEGGIVFLQSDVEAVMVEMCDRFQVHPSFSKQHKDMWLSTNPLLVSTERENAVFFQGKSIYRALFRKVARPSSLR